MKLLRFSTIDNNGIFSNTLNQELIIPPNSKIALGSCALHLDPDTLVIDALNDSVNIGIAGAPSVRTFKLAHTDGTGGLEFYDNNNYQLLFNDFMSKANNAIGSINGAAQIAIASEIGKQAQMKIDRNGKIEIKLNSSRSASYGEEVDANTPLKNLDLINKKPIVFGNAFSTMTANTATAQGDASYLCSTVQTYPIAKGCGIHRARIRRCANVGATAARGGASISLHTINPSTYIHNTNITQNDIAFGIKADAAFNAVTGALEGTYNFYVNGVETATIVQMQSNDATFTNNDVMSLEIVGSRCRGMVYQNNGGALRVNTLFDVVIDSSVDYYASYTIHGAGATAGAGNPIGCQLDFLRYTPDPYLQARSPTFDINLLADPDELGASTPTGQSAINSNHFIQFESNQVNNYLGFDNLRLPANGFLAGRRTVVFTADNIFKSGIENDCFMVEMLNLKIESYDFLESQRKRKNLLAVMPFNDTNNKLIFQPSNLVFLDLENKTEIKTTEIKLRIIRADYGKVELTGLSSLVAYIKSE